LIQFYAKPFGTRVIFGLCQMLPIWRVVQRNWVITCEFLYIRKLSLISKALYWFFMTEEICRKSRVNFRPLEPCPPAMEKNIFISVNLVLTSKLSAKVRDSWEFGFLIQLSKSGHISDFLYLFWNGALKVKSFHNQAVSGKISLYIFLKTFNDCWLFSAIQPAHQ